MDFSALQYVGIGGVALAAIYYGFQMFKIVISQWKQSTDAVNRNTKSFENLSSVFKQQSERELQFQKEIMETSKDTNLKVTEIHRKVVGDQ